MGSIPDEGRSRTAAAGTQEKENIGRCSEKEKYRTGIPPTEFRTSGNRPAPGRHPVRGNWTRTQQANIAVRIVRQAGRNGQRPAVAVSEWSARHGSSAAKSGPQANGEESNVRQTDQQEGAPGRKRRASGKRRTAEWRLFLYEKLVRQMERNGQRPSSETRKRYREETVARTRGQKMVSVRIPEETTEMTETTEIQFRRHW